MARQGSIYTYSIVRSATEAFKHKVPYVVALVDDGGERRACLLEGYAEGVPVSIGMVVGYSHDDERGNPVYRLSSQ